MASAEVAQPAQPAERSSIPTTPFPAQTTTATESIKGIATTATHISFSDKIFITVTQHGRLAHYVHVPLDTSATDASPSRPYLDDADADLPSSELLPMHHLTATTTFGGTIPELNILGQTLATQIASAILTRNPHERRMLVMGLGLDRQMSGAGAEGFAELVGLVLGVL